MLSLREHRSYDSKDSMSLEMRLQRLEGSMKVIVQGQTIEKFVNTKLISLVQLIGDYLSGPTITDTYGSNHTERRKSYERERIADQELYNWHQKNRLRYNVILALSYIPLIHQDTLKYLPNIQKKLQKLISTFPVDGDQYNKMTTQQKVLFSKNTAQELLNILDQLRIVDSLEITS